MHSSEYTDSGLARGKHVAVLGGSKSATDLAVNAAKNGAASVTLVYRAPVWRIPYFIGGINFKRLLYMRAQEGQFNGWGKRPLAARLAQPLIWANFRGLEMMLKMQLGLKRWDMVPDTPIEKEASCSLPIVTPGLFEGFKDGTIRPIRGSFTRYEPGKVVLTTGEAIPCDLAIMAVGWKLGTPWLPQEWRDKLVEADGQYRIYRLSVNPDIPNLGFVGFNSSFCTMPVGRDGRELAGAAHGRAARPPAQPRRGRGGYRGQSAVAPHPAPGGAGLRGPVFGALPFPAFRRTAGRHGRARTQARLFRREFFLSRRGRVRPVPGQRAAVPGCLNHKKPPKGETR